jgi:hypothetical protein
MSTNNIDAFTSVFGGGRGLSVDDTLLARSPSERAREELIALLQDTSESALTARARTLEQHMQLIDSRLLLTQLATWLAQQSLRNACTQLRPFIVAYTHALGITDMKTYWRISTALIGHLESQLLTRARVSADVFHVSVFALAPTLICENIAQHLGYGMYNSNREAALRALASADAVDDEIVARMARVLTAADYIAVVETGLVALAGKRPDTSEEIRSLIAATLFSEALWCFRCEVARRSADSAAKARAANAFLRQESERIAAISAQLPTDVSASEILRAFSHPPVSDLPS